ncbi:MAG: ABC transporter permease [Opitutaceae bacterium]|jgi:predicted permease
MTDIRFALRTLFKTPGFTAVIILTLALGIGANTALFSVINTSLLRPLPYEESERLVEVTSTTKGGDALSVAYPDFVDYKQQQQSFEAFTGFYTDSVNLTTSSGTERVSTAFVDCDFFRTLRVKPAAGADFSASDDLPAAAPLALVSHDTWQKRFGGAPDLIGRQVLLAGKSITVAGILPRNFRFYRPAEFYVPLAPFTQEFYMNMRQSHYGDFHVIARLKAGISLEAASAEVNAIATRLQKTYPKTNTGIGASTYSLQERIGGGSRETHFLLLGAVGMVLLIACVNVANMLLSRACAREKEMAVRVALGAGRMRIVRQLLTESLLLAGAGGIVGILFGQWLYTALDSLIPYGMRVLSANAASSNLDWRVIFFSVAVSLITGIAFGLAPAWQLSHASPHDALKDRSSSGTRHIGRFRVSDLLVVTEVALAAMLLIGAGLMIRSVWRLKNQSLGFQPEHLVTLQISTPSGRLNNDPVRVQAFYEQAAEAVRRLPGVEGVGIVNNLAFGYANSNIMFYLKDRPVPAAGEFPFVRNRSVDPDYFKTMGIPLVRGRIFERTDRRPAIPAGKADIPALLAAYRDFVIDAVVSQSFAKRYWPKEDAVGKVFRMGTPETPFGWVQITGIVGDVTQNSLGQDDFEEIYLSFRQWTMPAHFGLVIRASGEPASLISSIRNTLQEYSKLDPVYDIQLQTTRIENSVYDRQFNSRLFGFFAAVALILSLIGIYGVLAFAVGRRTREFGIRIALGARPGQMLREVLSRGLCLIVPGIAIGLFAAWILSRMIQSQLYGIAATDASTYAIAAIALLAAALVACWLPARRATRIDPVEALRAE